LRSGPAMPLDQRRRCVATGRNNNEEEEDMTKRALLTSVTTACMVSSLAVAAAQAETMRVITYLPPTHFAVTGGMEPFMDCVKNGTGGAIDFDFFPSGQIANAAG